MSQPSIKITETRTTSMRSSKLEVQPILSSPLPQAPLMSFDLHFDTLKDYLNNVTNIVNHQGTVLKTIIEELKIRTTSTDIIEIFASLSNGFPNELGKINLNRSGDEWKDTISAAVQKFSNLNERVVELLRFKKETQENIQDIHSKLKNKAEIQYVKKKNSKTKKTLNEEIRLKTELTMNHMKEEDDILSGRINELYRLFGDLEQKTLWKLKDCEDLLRVRVNEKYVMDAINGLEDKLRKNLEEANRGSLAKFERQLKELEKNLEKANSDTATKLKTLKDDLHEGINKKSSQLDHDNLKKDVENLFKSLKTITDFNIISKHSEHSQKITKLDELFNLIQNKINEENLSEELENLRGSIDQLQYELNKKADKSLIADMYSKSSEPKENLQEKHDFTEFWKFREKTAEQIRVIESKLEKLSKNPEIANIKKILNQKANEEEVKSDLNNHTFKISELEQHLSQNIKDLEALNSMLKKLSSTFSDFSHQSGLALLGRKQAAPQNCLSCGRGDTNFAPIQPQIMGRDGKVYKADQSIGKINKYTEEGYETGAEVFAMDTHEHAHFKRWEEHETSFREVKKVPLNVILGKEIRKSSSVLPSYNKGRPQSAKK